MKQLRFTLWYLLLIGVLIGPISNSSAVVQASTANFATTPTPATCLIYGVDMKGDGDAQLFTMSLRTKAIHPLGGRTGYDIEGIAIHPRTYTLYATASEHSKPPSQLFTVDSQTGALTVIGNTGFGDIADLAFRPTDASLWGWVENVGLIQIDLTTGAGTLVFASPKKIDGFAWNNNGSLLYGASGKKLWVYHTSDGAFTQLADNLPGKTTSLEMRPDGLLLGGVDEKNSVDIFAYDVATLQMTMRTSITDSRFDPNDIAWPAACGNASPGGKANMIQEVLVDKQNVCLGEDVHVSVRAEHPENPHGTVDIAINGQWGASQYLHFVDNPGSRLIQITALTPEKYSDSKQVTVNVINCNRTLPVVDTGPNPYHELTVDFHLTNATLLQLQSPTYTWDFGDGQTITTVVPYASHFYGDSLTPEQLYTVFQVGLTIQQAGQTELSTRTTIPVWNMYTFNKRLGFIQPRITSSGKAVLGDSALTADYSIKNLESQPLQLTSRQVEYQSCSSDQPPILSPLENVLIQLEGTQEVAEHFETPSASLPGDICNLAIHLAGQATDGMKVYVNAYFEVKENTATTLAVNDSTALQTLNQIIDQGLLGDVDTITDEDIYRLRQEGKIAPGEAGLMASSMPAAYSSSQARAAEAADVIGEICKKGDAPPRIGISCQVTKEWAYTPAYIVNALKGDIILDPGCDGTIGELLHSVSPPQVYSHSGLVVADHYQIRHATASENRYRDYGVGIIKPGDNGTRPDILKYGWPGTITQQVYQAYEGAYFTDPENGKHYLIGGFTKDPKRCAGKVGLVYPLVVKPLPEFEATARPKLHEVADLAQGINGHYRFFVYSNGAITVDPNYIAPEGTGWAVGTLPVVCSDFIWYATKLAGLTLEGSALEPQNVQLGAERDDATLDGLYLYTAEERKTAGEVLYQHIYNDAYDEAGWFGTLLTDAPSDNANQVTNCFASDWCDQAAKDSDQWRQTTVGRSVSPDNILFWDASPTGGYGYNERLAYQPGRYERVYRWLPSQGTGTVSGHVSYAGAPAQNALVSLVGLERTTGANGEFTFVAIPAGVYEIEASKQVGPDQLATDKRDVTVVADTTINVDLNLNFNPPPPPPAAVHVVIERVHGFGCWGTFVSPPWPLPDVCTFPEDPDFYAEVTIDGQFFSTRDNYVSDQNDISPNWNFSSQVDTSKASIPIHVHIGDVDGGLRGDDDTADINPNGGRDLNLIVDLSNCLVSGDASGVCDITIQSSGGNDGHEDLADIWFHISVIVGTNTTQQLESSGTSHLSASQEATKVRPAVAFTPTVSVYLPMMAGSGSDNIAISSWVGNSNNGKPMEFHINPVNNSVESFQVYVESPSCGKVGISWNYPVAVANGQFSYSSPAISFTGQISSTGSATGSYTLNTSLENCETLSESGTWTAQLLSIH